MIKTLQYILWIHVVLFYHSPLTGSDYYWVGGSGDWSDITHWATTSGGTVFHNVVPSAEDDVYFDANSFTSTGQNITVGNQIIFCKTMNWNGAGNTPTFFGESSAVMNLFGGLELVANMNFNFRGKVNFKSDTPGNTINLKGHRIFGDVILDGINGEWILASDWISEGIFKIINGNFKTQNFNLEVWSLQIINSFTLKTIDFGTSTITVTGNASQYFQNVVYFEHFNVQITSTNSKLVLNGERPFMRYYSNQELLFDSLVITNPIGNFIYEGLQDLVTEKLVFNNTLIQKNGQFRSNIDLGNCVIEGGRTVYFNGGSHFNFNNLITLGSCTQPIELLSSQSSVPALFFISGQNHSIDYTSIGGIHIQSGTPIDALNAANLFNNAGWNFVNETIVTLYWVGRSGNWDDPANWSFTSGGAGGACVPKGNNLVVFDENSFSASGQTVRVNILNPSCAGMEWRNLLSKPIFLSDRQPTLKIYGNLQLHPNMDYQFQGDIVLASDSSYATITTANHWLLNDVYIDQAAANYHLQDSLKIIDTLFLQAGGLFTKGEHILLNAFHSKTNAERRLHLYSSTINIEDYNAPYLIWEKFAFETENLTLDAGTSHIYINYGGIQQYGNADTVRLHNVTYWGSGDIYSDHQLIHFNKLTFWNNGYFSSAIITDSFEIQGGYEYQFYNSYDMETRIFLPNTSCADYAEITSEEVYGGSDFNIIEPDTFSYLILKNIHNQSSSPVYLNESINLYQTNTGWTFINENTGRTLYWVGDAGNWQDEQHWALTSGGTPGHCPPTLLDTAIFDQNSFTLSDQHVSTINHSMQQNARVLSIVGLDEANTSFNFNNLNIYGSIFMEDHALDFYSYQIKMKGEAPNEVIALAENSCEYIHFMNKGRWTLEAPLIVGFIEFTEGQLFTNDQDIEILSIYLYTTRFKKLDLTHSNVKILGNTYRSELDYSGDSLYILSSGSSIECPAPYPNFNFDLWGLNHRIDMGDVVFSSSDGTASINGYWNSKRLNFKQLDFRGNGRTELGFVVDSLLFSPGKKYNLAINDTLEVLSYWKVIGNNCTPIELESTLSGISAYVLLESGVISANYIQMKDQQALGQLPFLAGSFSSNISNNTGWLFESRQGFDEVGFLGEDQFLCQNDTLTISAYNNSFGETYLWSTGSINPTIDVRQSGIYTAKVTFANNCTVTDSIKVFDQQSFSDFLTEDTLICKGNSITIDATVPNYKTKYLWSNGDTTSMVTVGDSGMVQLTVRINECTFEDSLALGYVVLPPLEILGDSTFCDGDSTVLRVDPVAITAGYQTQWNLTGPTFTDSMLMIGTPGIYILNGLYEGCETADTLEVFEIPIPQLAGPFSFEPCEGDTLNIDAFLTGANYLWAHNGSSTSSVPIVQSGQYSVELEKEGCYNYFDYSVQFVEIPQFDLGTHAPLCQGETIELIIDVPADRFQWSTGSSTPTVQIGYPGGLIEATAFNQNCPFKTAVQIDFIDLPSIELGEDVTICQDESYVLDVTGLAERVEWMNGSTQPILEVTEEEMVRVTAYNDRCSMVDSIYISQERCYPFNTFLPNAISPNGDGVNDVFVPYFPPTLVIQKYTLQIYDRWGTLVFSTAQPDEPWDGNFNGSSLPVDTYIYHLALDYQDDYDSGSYQTSGTINIIR
jgi:gliding motility-associated-like protein